MKGITPLVSAFMAVLAVIVYFTILAPTASLAGQAEAQKTLYVANDLAILIQTAAFLPESSNYLLPDVLDAKAQIKANRLIIEGETTRIPKLYLPKNIVLKDTQKIDVDFIYVSKEQNTVTLTGTQTDACIKLPVRKSISIVSADGLEHSTNLAKEMQGLLKDLGYSTGDTTIKLLYADSEYIIVGTALDRMYTSLNCFLAKNLGYTRINDDRYDSELIVSYSQSTDIQALKANLIRAIEEYHE